jgi:hypothetical protein
LAEDLLRKYRPAGAPADLRARLLVPERAAWPWMAAAAALLALTVGLHAATAVMAKQSLAPTEDPFGFDTRVSLLAEAMGGNDEARRAAMLLVTGEEIERRLSMPAGDVPLGSSR